MSVLRAVGREVFLWIRVFRLYAFAASVLPVCLGSVYAWYETGRWDGVGFLLTLLAAVAYHLGCNMTNEYYDVKYGHDRQGTMGGSGALLDGAMAPRKMMIGIVAMFALGTILGLGLVYRCGPFLLGLGLFGLVSAIFYTASPWSAKAHAAGEWVVFLNMGVAITLGAYYVQAGRLSWNAVWISLPPAFLVTAILTANNIRDLADDRDSGIRTLAIVLGPSRARRFLDVLLAAPYLATAAFVGMGLAPWPVLLAWVTLPMALSLHRLFHHFSGEKQAELCDTPATTAKIHLAFNLLLCSGFLVQRWICG